MDLADIDKAIRDAKAEIAKHQARLDALELLRKQFTDDDVLQSAKQHSTLGGMETLSTNHKRNISASRTAGSEDAKFLEHIRSKGFTLRSLAAKIGVSPSMLSLNRRTHACPKDRAEKIEELTGWKADAKHWPAGISS